MRVELQFTDKNNSAMTQRAKRVVLASFYFTVADQLGAYLKACNSKSTCIIRQCGNRNNEGAIWDMLIIELDGNFIVT